MGTDATGTKAVVGSTEGIGIKVGPDNNTVGGTTSTARNVVAGNTTYGVILAYAVENTGPGQLHRR